MATTDCQTGVWKKALCTMIRNTADAPAPIHTQCSAKSPVSPFAVSPLNDFASTRHRSARPAMPPAISMPTANHITVSRTSTRFASAAMSPCERSHGGARIQPMTPPMNMLVLMRSPMMMPDPMFRNEMPNPMPTRAEKALTETGIVSTIH